MHKDSVGIWLESSVGELPAPRGIEGKGFPVNAEKANGSSPWKEEAEEEEKGSGTRRLLSSFWYLLLSSGQFLPSAYTYYLGLRSA